MTRVSRNTIELTILMPCLNEAETVQACICKAKYFLMNSKIDGEIVVVDNGSSDESQTFARNCGARVEIESNEGYGAALATGLRLARGRYVIMGDADDSYDFLELMPLVEKLREGYDLVVGNRFDGRIEKGAMPVLNRYLGNPLLSTIGRLLYKVDIGDFHSGLRGCKRSSILELDLHAPGMEYASEMIIKAALHGLRITEVPITLRKDGRSHPSHLRRWRDAWRHLKIMFMHIRIDR